MNEEEIIFVDPPGYDHLCPVCYELLEDSHQTTCCGNHVCDKCSNQLNNGVCPFCRNNFNAGPDKFFSRQLLSLEVECYNCIRGCPWTGELRDLKKHADEECRKNNVKCGHCSIEFSRKRFPEHVHVCVEAPERCPNQCPVEGLKRKDMKQHLEQACPMRAVSEGAAGVPRSASNVVQTAPLAVTLTNYSRHVATRDTWYSPPFYSHENGYKLHLRVDANLKGFVSVLVCVLKGEYDRTLSWPLYAEVELSLYNWQTNKPLYSKTLCLPGDGFCTINTSNLPSPWGKGDLEFVAHDNLRSNLAEDKELVKYDCLNIQINRVTVLRKPNIPNLPQWANRGCITVPAFSSFQNKKSFYSPPMYTDRGGYKFSLRVDPKGISDRSGSHMSVYCHLMKGENDDKLLWPIEADIIVKMLNWREDKNHKSYTVTLNQGSGDKAISRVTKGSLAEQCYGSPKFAAHSSLLYNAATNTEYLKDDCLLFKVGPVSAYFDKASSTKLPPWLPSSPYPCVTVPEFTKRKATGNSFYSKPFYSHKDGYKMQLKIHTASGQNVGVYVFLMQGPNDDHLQWPFRGDIVVELVNWRGDRGHHSNMISLSSQCTNTVCNRVTTGERGADCWGYNSFIGHSSLPLNAETGVEYLQNDCLHLRVKQVVVHSRPMQYKVPTWQGHRPSPSHFQFTVNNVGGRNLLQNNFYSPAFYTHRGGYKMRLEVGFRENHQGRKSLAIFARLLQGENDARLGWPLSADIVVELLNWRYDGKHHSYRIDYHERLSTKFNGRVQAGGSAESGWGTSSLLPYDSLAYNHSTNTEYLQGDCLCFRVKRVAAYSSSFLGKAPRWQPRNAPASFTITDVAERRELDNIYYSPTFVASGYHMCLKVYVGGRGAQKGKHVSMYACLLKGERDEQLEWPFCGDIVVEVLNWRGDNGHYKKALSLDSPDDDSHARVMTEVLEPGGYGKAQFIPLSNLPQYLEEQCMRIRVSNVACYNTPLRFKAPRWQGRSNFPLVFNVTGFSSRLTYGSVCYSPPFYTHNKGYKMRLEVTAGETGEDKSNMSIYARLMTGEYDSSLKWPMNVNLTIEVLNWKANSFHLTEILKFGNASADYRSRVPEGRKTAPGCWGFGQFCTHAKLYSESRNVAYVQDDCVRIRVRAATVFSRKGLF